MRNVVPVEFPEYTLNIRKVRSVFEVWEAVVANDTSNLALGLLEYLGMQCHLENKHDHRRYRLQRASMRHGANVYIASFKTYRIGSRL